MATSTRVTTAYVDVLYTPSNAEVRANQMAQEVVFTPSDANVRVRSLTIETLMAASAQVTDVFIASSIDEMEFSPSAVSMIHIYGGPYLYSNMVYILGIEGGSNAQFNAVRTNSAPVSSDSNWSATWTGIGLADDVRAYDSIQHESIIQVAIQVSTGDVTYHEFHISNETWDTTNEAVASAGVGGVDQAAATGVALQRQSSGDLVIAAILSHTTSSLDQQMIYVRSGGTTWDSQGPANPAQAAGRDAVGVGLVGPDTRDDMVVLLNDDASAIDMVHLASDGTLGSYVRPISDAAAGVKAFGYHKGLGASGHFHFVYANSAGNPIAVVMDISTAPVSLSSHTQISTSWADFDTSGVHGGVVQLSNMVTFVHANGRRGFRNRGGFGRSNKWEQVFTETEPTNAFFHNLISFLQTSFGSALEIFAQGTKGHNKKPKKPKKKKVDVDPVSDFKPNKMKRSHATPGAVTIGKASLTIGRV